MSKHQREEGLEVECTVPVEVHLATEHADVGSLERTVSTALAEIGVRLWRELVARLEAALPVPVACPACGGPVKANGRAPRRLVTLSGEVDLRRQRYRCRPAGSSRSRSTPRSVSSRARSTRSASASVGCGWSPR
ncbi:MAG: hypothetical protein FIA92_09280 [Chloroflexi bacterium]|nr:hypothetical protein [Chloroflexota bacterium]